MCVYLSYKHLLFVRDQDASFRLIFFKEQLKVIDVPQIKFYARDNRIFKKKRIVCVKNKKNPKTINQ